MMQYSNKTILYTIETSVISLILTVRKTNILKRHPLNTPSVRFVGNSNITKVADSVKGATIGSNHTISTSIKTATPSTSPNKGAAVSNTTKETSTTTTSNNTEVSVSSNTSYTNKSIFSSTNISKPIPSVKDKIPSNMPPGYYGLFQKTKNASTDKEKDIMIPSTTSDTIQSPSNTPNNSKPFKESKPISTHKPTDEEVLKTFSGTPFIVKCKTLEDIYKLPLDEQLDELSKRHLASKDAGNTTVTIKLEDNSEVILGESKNGYKLTSLGQAYFKLLKNNENPKVQPMPIENVEGKDLEFLIVIPPKSGDNTIINIALHKHMLVGHWQNTDDFFVFKYLTSKKTGKLIAPFKFKKYQEMQEKSLPSLDISKEEKPQHMVSFDFLQRLGKSEIMQVKWGKKYIQNLEKQVLETLKRDYEDKIAKGYQELPKEGVTTEDIAKIIIMHDQIARSGGKQKHPLPEDLIKKNKENTLKQKEQNKIKMQYE